MTTIRQKLDTLSFIKTICYNLYYRLFPYSLEHSVAKELRGCKTILDAGCGDGGFMQRVLEFLPEDIMVVGCDIYEPYLKKANERNIYHYVEKKDLRNLTFPFRFDAVLANNTLEHLDKNYRYIKQLELLALKKVIIATPNGYLKSEIKGLPTETHLCGYTLKEMRDLGYEVRGWDQKYFCRLWHISPFGIRFIISALSHFSNAISYYFPETGAHILCTKEFP